MRRILLPLLCIALGACATQSTADSGPAEPTPAIYQTGTAVEVRLANGERGISSPLPASPPLVFDALVSVMQDLGIEADILDARERRYGASRVTGSRIAKEPTNTLLRCGNAGAGPSAVARLRFRLSVVSQVDPAPDGGSLLTTKVEGTAVPVDGTSTSMSNCVSTGRLEERIAEGVRMVVAVRSGRD